MIGKRECKPAREILALVCDQATFVQGAAKPGADPQGIDCPQPYAERLRQARAATGLQSAVLWGSASIGGYPCTVLANEFGFIGGSLGTVEAAEIVRAMEAAADRHVPLIWLAASGGCRLMEGIASLLCVPRILAARGRLADEAVPFVAVTVGPHLGADRLITTQSDFALGVEHTWLGFVGPKAIEEFDKTAAPEGFQSTEWALANGQLDEVVPLAGLHDRLATLLAVLASAEPQPPSAATGTAPQSRSAWESVVAARTTRPSARKLYEEMAEKRFDLAGDRVCDDDPAVMGGVARVAGRPVVVIGHNAPAGRSTAEGIAVNFQMPHPSGYRKALRLVHLADRLRLPIVTLIDSPGTCPDVASEAGNQAGVLGELAAAMLRVRVPSIGVVVGEAVGAGALPLATVDRLLILGGGYYSIVVPEAAAAILLGDASRAADAAALLKLSPSELRDVGAVDAVVSASAGGRELGQSIVSALDDAARSPSGMGRRVRAVARGS